ncbi:hypothetical protein E2C01_062407 [Portunus trituberculatus]|uniref:Uncharacterized protein n=1 Tax=Portunus trituberculatus TaxID=210409 RepID=A0A5B7H7S8_PORTR|nr:hypothetical protein [Portunus trituberculatus]
MELPCIFCASDRRLGSNSSSSSCALYCPDSLRRSRTKDALQSTFFGYYLLTEYSIYKIDALTIHNQKDLNLVCISGGS